MRNATECGMHGNVRRRLRDRASALLCCYCIHRLRGFFHRHDGLGGPAPIENPLFVPPMDRELLWNQTVDAVDDYFRIEREERVRLIGGVLTEGRIDTFPTIGSTILEPWRRDSTPAMRNCTRRCSRFAGGRRCA